jgi:hypothetical protein
LLKALHLFFFIFHFQSSTFDASLPQADSTFILGVSAAVLTAMLLNRFRLSRYFFYPPLVFLALAVISETTFSTSFVSILCPMASLMSARISASMPVWLRSASIMEKGGWFVRVASLM